MDMRWTYRVGAPALNAPPFDNIGAQWIPEWSDGVFRQSVARILQDAQVRVLGYGLVKRVRPGQTPSQTPLTLLVTSDVSVNGQYAAWKVAVSDLRLLFDKANREDITVEITDIRKADGVPSAPLTDCAPELVAAWECYRPALLEDIQEQQWLTADIVLREIGELHPIRAPTLLITAQDADSAIWWDKILPHIRQQLPQAMEVDLLYAPHLAMQTSGDEEEAEEPYVRPAIYSTMQDYDAVVKMGASIGVEQPDNSGTVGAVLVLKDAAGNETNCALTNHHVVATHDPTSVINRGMSVGEYLSVNHEISQLGLVKIKAPSNPDHTRFLKYKAMDKYEHDQAVASFDNPYHPEYAWAQSMAAATNKDCEFLDADPNRLLGTVIASSGYRARKNDDYSPVEAQRLSTVVNVPDDAFKRKDGTHPPTLADKIAGRTLKFALDWALIKVATGRTMSDRVPIGGTGIKVPIGAEVTRFTKIKQTQSLQVAKKGRTTGWTYGHINQIGSLLNLRHDSTSIVPADMEQRFGTTDGVMLAFGVMHDRKGEEFMRAGDSGSCVLLNERNSRKATIVGLLYTFNEHTRVSYMIPFDLVIKDIEQVTDQKVVKPEFVEYDARICVFKP